MVKAVNCAWGLKNKYITKKSGFTLQRYVIIVDLLQPPTHEVWRTHTHLGFVCLWHSVGSGAKLSSDGNRGLWDQIGQLGSGPLADRGSAKKKKSKSCSWTAVIYIHHFTHMSILRTQEYIAATRLCWHCCSSSSCTHYHLLVMVVTDDLKPPLLLHHL